MKRIPLTQGKFALVNNRDFAWLSQWKWIYHKGYAIRHLSNTGHPRQLFMHRQITDCPKGMEVDHINGDGLDNRRSNLRVCTRTENRRNSGKFSNNKSGHKGVYWRPERNCWIARIRFEGKYLHLTSSKNINVAAKAYKEAVKKLHGPFANLKI